MLPGFLYLEENETYKVFSELGVALKLNPYSDDAKTGLGTALISKGNINWDIEVLSDAALANPYLPSEAECYVLVTLIQCLTASNTLN